MGVQTADNIHIKGAILSENMAVTFNLIFEVIINRKDSVKICMGNQVFMPSLGEKGVIDDIITLQLNKGPGENYENDLILSEESVLHDFNVFDIIIQG
jgi:hypothetical protein